MKLTKLIARILMVPILLAMLCAATGCYCVAPWDWGEHRRDGGDRGDCHYDGDRGDRHHDGRR